MPWILKRSPNLDYTFKGKTPDALCGLYLRYVLAFIKRNGRTAFIVSHQYALYNSYVNLEESMGNKRGSESVAGGIEPHGTEM
jgi:hypothetical protein